MTYIVMDYEDAMGRNVVKRWIGSLGPQARKEVKAALNVHVGWIETASKLDRSTVGVGILGGRECRGLLEIIMLVGNVQYRPLAAYGPEAGQVTIFAGATEHNRRITPPGACATALRRKADLANGIGRVIRHDRS